MNTELFKNKYRIPPARLQNWDYGWNAAYFITICTKNRECFLGYVLDREMHLSEPGKLANQFWFEIHDHFLFIEFGVFVVMPNHIHGILIINKSDNDVDVRGTDKACKSLQQISTRIQIPINPISARLGKNVFRAREKILFLLCDEESFKKISEYIINNPANWKDDKFYKTNKINLE